MFSVPYLGSVFFTLWLCRGSMSYGFVLPVRCPISERVTTSTNQFWIKMCERSTVHGYVRFSWLA